MDKRPQRWQVHITIGNALYNWDEQLARYQVDILLLQKDKHPELIAVDTTSPWQHTHEDDQYVVFEQRGSS